jgi:hypothetical protein
MPEDELDILLAHELAHVRRMDALVNGLQAAAQALLWWNPVVWWLNRRIREEREFCCDDLVLSRGIATGAAYSRTLVNVAERVSLPSSSWAMAGMADNFGAIDRRVRRALQAKGERSGWRHYGALVALLLVAGWVLPGATDGAEKEFDATEAAKVESAYRIHEMKSEEVGRNAAGAPLRSGKISFRVRSSSAEVPHLEMSATGEFLYPDAAGDAEKCVLTGEIKAIHRDMSFAASRVEFYKDGVVDFGKATLDTDRIKALTSESMVLDLRDGTLAMQDGRAEQVNVEGAETLLESAPVAEISPAQEPGEIDSVESNAAPIGPLMKIDAGSMIGNIQTGFLSALEDATITFFPGREGAEIPVQGEHLKFSAMDAANRSGVIEGNMQASRDEFTISAPRLEYSETLLFSNAVLDSRDFGTVQAEEIRVDTVARLLHILNGTVDESRLKAAFGENAKNAARGEWLTLPFVVARQVAIDSVIVEIDRDADIVITNGLRLARIIEEKRFVITDDSKGIKWEAIQVELGKLVNKKQAKILSAPKLVAVAGEKASISIGRQVPTGEEAAVGSDFLGLSLDVLPTVQQLEDKSDGISLDLQFQLTTQGESFDGTPAESVRDWTVKLPAGASGRWLCQVLDQSGERVKLVLAKAEIVIGEVSYVN